MDLVLRVWETLTTERDLDGVLKAVTTLLQPLVAFQGVGVVGFAAEERPIPLHIPGGPRGVRPNALGRQVPRIPFAGSELAEQHAKGKPYSCPDLRKKPAWLPHEFGMAAGGVRAYAAIPLTAKGERVGIATFGRQRPEPYTPQELALLESVAPAIGVAVANALANQQIRKLREQLEAENVMLRSQLTELRGFEELVGTSASLHGALEAVQQVAPTDATVLITGETGTGKELLARAIHNLSPRAKGPLVKVNCAAIPPTLIASELFGHERGAFTGAVDRRKGRFEQASGGTLFLDEIGDLPLDVQSTILRVLQEREFERVGGGTSIRTDARIVAATNRRLAEEVEGGRFRKDLYYRLSVFPIHAPALRERPEDIAPLVAFFVSRYAARFGKTITRIDRRSLAALERYAWPGNVRELENLVERAVILARNGRLQVDLRGLPPWNGAAGMRDDLRAREKEVIEGALSASSGRIAGSGGAAARLGVPPSTLESKIGRLGIDKYRFRRKS
jgi:formate hydrogenlyase transcriptional activator